MRVSEEVDQAELMPYLFHRLSVLIHRYRLYEGFSLGAYGKRLLLTVISHRVGIWYSDISSLRVGLICLYSRCVFLSTSV